MSGDRVQVGQKGEKETIGVNVGSNEICSCFQGEEVVVTEGKAEYKRKGKVVDAREDEQKYGEDDMLPADYIQPRLFVINNDNTGIELLSEAMVQNYIERHEKSIEKVYSKAQSDKTQVYIV